MKWFKHKTDCSSREFMAILEDQFGLEGYARWFKILEEIGKNMSGENGCSAIYPWSKWQTILKGKRKKLGTFLEHLENKSKIKLKENGEILEIECRKILEIKDEYSRKSGHCPEELPTNSLLRGKSKDKRVKIKEGGGGNTKTPADPDLVNPPPPPPPQGVDDFLAQANQAHQVELGHALPPATARDRERVAALLAQHPPDLLAAAFLAFVVSSDPWLVKNEKPRNVAVFAGQVAAGNYLAAGADRLRAERKAPAEAAVQARDRPPGEPTEEDRARWEVCFKSLFGALPEETVTTWFAPLEFGGVANGAAWIVCPNDYYRKCLHENYLDLLTTRIREYCPEAREVRLAVAEVGE